MKVQGWDISLNHGAVVQLVDGELADFMYYTTNASSANKGKARKKRGLPRYGERLVLAKTNDPHVRSIERLLWVQRFLYIWATRTKPAFIGIEDYAIRAAQGAHYLGEVGCIARLQAYNIGAKVRLHDPTSVKLFAAHDGNAKKDAVGRAVQERFEVCFEQYDPDPPKPTKKNKEPKQNRTTSEDLADAFAIAKLVDLEVRLRSGEAMLKGLHHKEVQVFNRCTRTYPVSLLDRDWIERSDHG